MANGIRELGDGLVLRWSTADDVERLAACMGRAFGKPDEPDRSLEHMVRRYMRGDYPFMSPEDFALVEDTSRSERPVVAGACYLREEWSYDGISLPAARPEIVGSDHGYRNKGLVRAVFDLIHERAAVEHTLLQGITGIQYFYRQFGYEYALALGGGVHVPVDSIPALGDGEPEPYVVRHAVAADLDAVEQCYRCEQESSLVGLRIPREFWRYLIDAEAAGDGLGEHYRLRVVECADGGVRGFLVLSYERHGDNYGTVLSGFARGVDLSTMQPSLLRGLRAEAEAAPARKPDEPVRTVSFGLGREQPAMQVLRGVKGVRVDTPYAWYIRIPDVVAFVRHIAPALEARLAASPFASHSGDVSLYTYRDCVKISFVDGFVAEVSTVDATDADRRGGVAMPPLVLNQVLMGYRSIGELARIYPDVGVNEQARPLLDVLFPARASHVFGI